MLLLLLFYLTNSVLLPYKHETFPITAIKPQGWLNTQLNIQAAGLSGHLQHFWPDVENSIWIGGNADGGLHERTPYWLNGVVPLSFLVNDTQLTQDTLHYINYIMSHQQPSGWLGPDDDKSGNQYWSKWDILFALQIYVEGIQDSNITLANNVKKVMLNYILEQQKRMQTTPLDGWAAARYQDFVLSCQWMLENGGDIINGYENNLNQVITTSFNQGYKWEDWFNLKSTPQGTFPTTAVPGNECTMYNHGVNNAQAFKSAAVMYRSTNNTEYIEDSLTRLTNMDLYHGQPTGMFSCEEHLAGRVTSRGTETCTVVEYMYSFEIMFKVFGNILYLDRLEQITYNALPATWASPKGGDMWNHQYLQQNNELNAMYTDPHIWVSDGPNSTVYGLEPNYGCCTANFNQGWPKFIYSIFYITNNNQLTIGVYAPAYINLNKYLNIGNNAMVNISTNYPFDDDINIYINNINKSFYLNLRIPTWVNENNVILQLNGEQQNNIVAGQMYRIQINPNNNGNKIYLNFKPNLRFYESVNGSVSILRGSLLFSLPINGSYYLWDTYSYESADYQVYPNSEWRYALIVNNTKNIDNSFKVEMNQFIKNHAPFNRTNIPIKLIGKARNIYSWTEANNAIGVPPKSPACNNGDCGNNDIDIELVPHGCTDLRIASFPLAFSSV